MIGSVSFATLLACRVTLGAADGPAYPVALHSLYRDAVHSAGARSRAASRKWHASSATRAQPLSIAPTVILYAASSSAPGVASVVLSATCHAAENTAAKAKKSGSQWTLRWREVDSNRQFEHQIGGAPRHRSGDGEISAHRRYRGLRRTRAALRYQIEGRLM
jgi:hypothetical protein